MGRGDMPTEIGDSLFSSKCSSVQRHMFSYGGRALDWLGALSVTKPNQTPNAVTLECGSATTGDEIRGREGKNPDHQLRSSSLGSVVNDVGLFRQPGGWLRSSHPLKSA